MKAAFLFCLFTLSGFAQSDLDKLIKSGELIVTGLAVFKDKDKAGDTSTIIDKVCVKNKLTDKITLNVSGKDIEGNRITKSLVIVSDGKECLLELPKGIYSYEIVLSNKEIFKRGEYRFDESMTITVKAP